MASKNLNRNLSFGSTPLPARRLLGRRVGATPRRADLEITGILEKTRTQGYLGEIDRVVDWPLARRADG
jgi:hypothetical protein